MKATGIVRKFDENGRFVLPMELRKMLGLTGPDAALEVFTEDDRIILRKYEPFCVFCGTSEDLTLFREKRVCKACAKKIAVLADE